MVAEWELNDDTSSVTEVVRVLKSMSPDGYSDMDFAVMRKMLDRKTARCSVKVDGDKSLAQVWVYSKDRKMWRIHHVGFGSGWTPVKAMRANVRYSRRQMDALEITKTYAIATFPSGSTRLDRYIEKMEQQVWEMTILEDQPTFKVYLYDRSDRTRLREDEQWRNRR